MVDTATGERIAGRIRAYRDVMEFHEGPDIYYCTAVLSCGHRVPYAKRSYQPSRQMICTQCEAEHEQD